MRLLPWMYSVKANSGVWMENTRLRDPLIRPLLHPRPCEVTLPTPMDQRGPPESDHPVAECGQTVGDPKQRPSCIDRSGNQCQRSRLEGRSKSLANGERLRHLHPAIGRRSGVPISDLRQRVRRKIRVGFKLRELRGVTSFAGGGGRRIAFPEGITRVVHWPAPGSI
jgi:hypothetical protein